MSDYEVELCMSNRVFDDLTNNRENSSTNNYASSKRSNNVLVDALEAFRKDDNVRSFCESLYNLSQTQRTSSTDSWINRYAADKLERWSKV